MVDLEFSLIGEAPPSLLHMLEVFQAKSNIQVRLRMMTWEKAWPDLLACALYGKGPDVSHIGSTWTSSLVAMNALRPFTAREVRDFGGSETFLDQCWQSGIMPGQSECWSAPWTAYTHLLCYRRDLLKKAGIAEEKAFESANALEQTLAQLRASGVEYPWITPTNPANPDVVHLVASWVWGGGGDYIDTDGRRILFTLPGAMRSIQAYFDLLQFMQPSAYRMDSDQVEALFTQGGAAVILVGADRPFTWQRDHLLEPGIADNVGVTVIPGVPWVGGDNLVIWKSTQFSYDRERAAESLVDYLIGRSSQELYGREDALLPTRADAFNTLPLPGSDANRAVVRALRTGRAYTPIAMWGRIEHQLGVTFGQISEDIFSGVNPADATQKRLAQLSHRLEITLSS